MSESHPRTVIVGAGLAGFHVASGLARNGCLDEVTVLGEECCAPYDRPPLSKEFQLGGEESALWLSPELPPGVRYVPGRKAIALQTARRELHLDDGSVMHWDRLVLATGSRPRALPHLACSSRVHTLRTLEHARAIRTALAATRSLLVIGGGPIGLELASAARQLGYTASVVELAPRLMARSVPSPMAQLLLDHHRARGIAVHLGRTVASIDDAAGEALLDNGQRISAGVVVVGIGVQANDELAAQAGIACDDGIFVDACCRTTAPGVFAVGDVTRQRNPVTGRFERIETWSNAQGQAQTLARILCDPAGAGSGAAPFDAVPWFWSDQGEARLQVAGSTTGEMQAWCAVPATGSHVLVQWTGGRVVGVATLNAAREFAQLRRLIVPRQTLSPEQLSAPGANIRALVQQALAA